MSQTSENITIQGSADAQWDGSSDNNIEHELANLHKVINQLERFVNESLEGQLDTVLQPDPSKDESDEQVAYARSPVWKEVRIARERLEDLHKNLNDITSRLDLSGEM